MPMLDFSSGSKGDACLSLLGLINSCSLTITTSEGVSIMIGSVVFYCSANGGNLVK
jgi:hypothetical protein